MNDAPQQRGDSEQDAGAEHDDGRKPLPSARGLRQTFGDDFARYSGLGCQFGMTITLLSLGGLWLDSKLGTRPWFLLLGVLLGFVGAMISLLSNVPGSGISRRRRDSK